MDKYIELLEEYVSASIHKNVPSKSKMLKNLLAEDSTSEELKRILRKIEEKRILDKKLVRVCDFEKRSTSSSVAFEVQTLKCGEDIKIYTITTPQELVSYVGYAKYINRGGYNVYLRGQDNVYEGMIPSLLRGKTQQKTVYDNMHRLLNIINRSNTKLEDYHYIIMESIFQHYGMKTTMLDLVDNIWVALWFGLHSAKSVTLGNYQHIQYNMRNDGYAYIFLLASDALEECLNYGRRRDDVMYSGIYEGELTRMVDLRRAIQGTFLRPHAQHGVMLSKKGNNSDGSLCASDYSDLIVGIAKIPVEIGRKWLGDSEMLTVNTLFPSAVYDGGYRMVLDSFSKIDMTKYDDKLYGRIQILN